MGGLVHLNEGVASAVVKELNQKAKLKLPVYVPTLHLIWAFD